MTEGTSAAGVDLGGASLKLVLLDGNGRVVARETVPTEAASGPGAVPRGLAEVVPKDAAARLAVGVPARVVMDEGEVDDALNLPGAWEGLPVGPRSRRRPACRRGRSTTPGP